MDNDNPLNQPEVAALEPEIVSQPEPAPEPEAAPLPDYLTNPDAVSKDEGAQWRFGRAPNYANTRRVWREEKTANHATGSLPELVENLVKNWEVEASFKTRLSEWRTIDHENYTFAMNGEAPQTAEHMLKCGTYNAIITPNEYYCPLHSDFASSHKTFKRMMPTFAWEVLEVYSGPPKVAFKWRHWGVMKNDYVGFNDKGEKVTAKAHGGPIEIFGVTVASVDDKVRLQSVETYMDPLQMFRRIAPNGIVNKQPMNRKVELADALDPEPEHKGPATGFDAQQPASATTMVSDVEQSASETSVEPKSSLNACPFASLQQMDVETSVQSPEVVSNGIGSPAAGTSVEIPHVEPLQMVVESIDDPSTEKQFQDPISNSQPHKPESGQVGMDLDTEAPAIVEGHNISNAPETQPDPTESRHNDMQLDVQAPTIVEEHTTSNAQDTQPVLADTTTVAEESTPNPDSGAHKAMDMDTQAQTTVEKHTTPSAQNTEPALNGNAAAVEEGATSPDTGDLHSTVADTGDTDRKPTAIAEHNEQQTTDDSQAVASIRETSASINQKTNGESQVQPMSDTHPAQDVHPHRKDVEEHVQPEAGEAVAASPGTKEAQKTHEQMSNITAQESEQMNIE